MGLGWDGYLLGPTLRAPYGANKYRVKSIFFARKILKSSIITFIAHCLNAIDVSSALWSFDVRLFGFGVFGF